MPYVKFIPDEAYRKIVSEILTIGFDAKKNAEAKFGKNVIDPFARVLPHGRF
jgi:hypothetical protein